MRHDQETAHGVDVAHLEDFLEAADEHPGSVRLGLAARSTYEGTCGYSLAKVDSYTFGGERIARETREYTIPFGSWKEVTDAAGWVGAEDRLEPIEVALAALAACINFGITVNALLHGVDIERLQTRVRTEFDPRMLFGIEPLHETDDVFETITAEIEIEADDLEKDLVDEWARRAPVYTMLSQPQDVDLTITSPTEVGVEK